MQQEMMTRIKINARNDADYDAMICDALSS